MYSQDIKLHYSLLFQVYRFNIIPGYPVLELMTKAIAEFDLQGKVSC